MYEGFQIRQSSYSAKFKKVQRLFSSGDYSPTLAPVVERTEDLADSDGSQPLCSPLDVALSLSSTQTTHIDGVSYH